LSRGNEAGWTSFLILASLATGGTALLGLYLLERRTADPILNLALFRNREFSFAITTTMLALVLLSGGNFLVPFYLEIIKGLSPEHVGAVVMIYSVVYMPIGPYAGKLSDRISPRRLCTGAMAVAFIACLLFALTLPLAGILPIIVYLTLLAVAYAFFFPANNHLVMALAPPDHQGSASAIYSTVMNVGMVLGVCLFEGTFAQALPGGMSTRNLHPETAAAFRDGVSGSFQTAFFVGAFFSLLSFSLSFLAGRRVATPSRRP